MLRVPQQSQNISASPQLRSLFFPSPPAWDLISWGIKRKQQRRALMYSVFWHIKQGPCFPISIPVETRSKQFLLGSKCVQKQRTPVTCFFTSAWAVAWCSVRSRHLGSVFCTPRLSVLFPPRPVAQQAPTPASSLQGSKFVMWVLKAPGMTLVIDRKILARAISHFLIPLLNTYTSQVYPGCI